jgi:outer membrane protein assembly factor BamB
VVVVLVGCEQGASVPPTTPPAPVPVTGVVPMQIWQIDGIEPFTVAGNSLLAYDRGRDGIAEIATATGAETRFRKIASSPASGTPGMWVPVDDGAIVSWDERIVFIRDRAGVLSFGWMVGENSYYEGVGGGDVVWLGKSRDEAGLYAINVKDGSTRWSVRFPDGIQGFEMAGDSTTIVTSHQEYQHMPPGDRDIFHVLGAYAAATGKQRWRTLLPFEPSVVAIGIGGAVAVTDDSILLFDGESGTRHDVKLAQRASAHALVDRGLAIIVDDNANTLSTYSIRDGKLLWEVALPADPSVGIVALAAGLAARGDLVFVSLHGAVHAYDRATGKLAWSVQTGWEPERIAVTETAVVEMDGHTASGFALPTTAPGLETATVHGVVRAMRCATPSSLWVRVGTTRVRPDARGRFSATIQATGRITVGVPYNRRDDHPPTSRVEIDLTGKGDYATPDLVADACGYNYE